MENSIKFQLHGLVTDAFFFEKNGESGIIFAYGDVSTEAPIDVRFHSACCFSEVFGSPDCDCRSQLLSYIEKMRASGRGLLVYLFQEGRGAGLRNKFDAYGLSQRFGLDTVEAYDRLGLEQDSRNYLVAAELLGKIINTRELILHTNNYRKIEQLRSLGYSIRDERCVGSGLSSTAENYLETKRKKLGHL